MEGRKIRGWRVRGGGGGEDAPQTAAQTLNEELKDPAVYKATMYQGSLHFMGLTAESLLSSWTALPLSVWTA